MAAGDQDAPPNSSTFIPTSGTPTTVITIFSVRLAQVQVGAVAQRLPANRLGFDGGEFGEFYLQVKQQRFAHYGNTLPANSRSGSSLIGLLVATTHKSKAAGRRLPATAGKPFVFSVRINSLSVKPQ